jgi:hypothetical protein
MRTPGFDGSARLPKWYELPKLGQSRTRVALQAGEFLRPSKNLLIVAKSGEVQHAAPRRAGGLGG